MAKYKYRLVKEEQWHFELLPNNSNECYVAKSGNYKSKDKALAGMEKFKSFLNEKRKEEIENKVIIGSNDKGKPVSIFKFSNTEHFETRTQVNSYELKRAANRVIKNYNADLRAELNIE